MIRTLFLVMSVLIVLVTPRPAHGRGDAHGHDSHHRGHHVHHFVDGIYAPFPCGPPYREDGHWIGQFYVDRYGNATPVPLWVPPHWNCWY